MHDVRRGLAAAPERHVNTARSNRTSALLLFTVALLVVLPNLVWLGCSDRLYLAHSTPYILMTAVMPALIIVPGLFAILGRWPWVSAALCLPFLALVPVETAYIVRYGDPTSYSIIATILESNSREAIDFLGALIWPLLAAVVACVLFGAVAAVYLYRSGYTWTHRSRVWVLTACVTAAAMPYVLALAHPPQATNATATASGASAASNLSPEVPLWMRKIEPSFPAGVVVRLYRYHVEWQAMRRSVDQLHAFEFHARQTANVSERQIYVLVIGETGRRDRWHLYGYERATTPELEALPNLIKFDDMISPWPASRMSVPLFVTRKRAAETKASFDERSIMHAFAETGFETYWMSNQLAVGEFDSPIAVVAHDAEHVAFYNVADWGQAGNYDDVLLAPLKAALATPASKLFIVLHTLGSHANYAFRYPPAFERFTPSLRGLTDPDYYVLANAQRSSNSYDNSILYTDHFLAAVAGVLRESNAVSTMWYAADHGEDLITPECKFAGHGNGTIYDFMVPAVFWYSDSYARAFPAELARLRQHSVEKITTENLFESMIDMAGLDFPGHDRTWSLFSDQWQPHQRLAHALFDVDFDGADRSSKCQMLWPHER